MTVYFPVESHQIQDLTPERGCSVRRTVVVGFMLVLLSAFCFAVSGPVAKALYVVGWTPGSVVLVRLFGSALLLLLPTLLSLRGQWGEVRRHWKTIVVYGIVAMAGVQAFFFLAVEHLSVAVAILLEMMGAPLIIVLWMWVRTRRRPATVTFIGVGVSLVGVLLVLDFTGTSISWFGIAMALAAAACLAGYFMVSSDHSIRVPPIAVTGLGMCVGALVAAAMVATRVLPARFVAAEVPFAGLSVSWVFPVGLLILFTVGAYVFGIIGIRYIGATVGSFTNLTEVLFSAIAAWVILAEALTPVQVVGGLVILIGIVFIKWGDVRLERRIRESREFHETLPDPDSAIYR